MHFGPTWFKGFGFCSFVNLSQDSPFVFFSLSCSLLISLFLGHWSCLWSWSYICSANNLACYSCFFLNKKFETLRAWCVKVNTICLVDVKTCQNWSEMLSLESLFFVFKESEKPVSALTSFFSYMHWVWLFLVNSIAGCS